VADTWPGIDYEMARAAYDAGQKLHHRGQIFLVRPALREPAAGLVLWVADQESVGEHGLLLFPDGRVEAR